MRSFPMWLPEPTKHLGVKCLWLKSHIVEGGKIKVKAISAKIQKADIFAKGFRKKEFEEKRFLILGWKVANDISLERESESSRRVSNSEELMRPMALD